MRAEDTPLDLTYVYFCAVPVLVSVTDDLVHRLFVSSHRIRSSDLYVKIHVRSQIRRDLLVSTLVLKSARHFCPRHSYSNPPRPFCPRHSYSNPPRSFCPRPPFAHVKIHVVRSAATISHGVRDSFSHVEIHVLKLLSRENTRYPIRRNLLVRRLSACPWSELAPGPCVSASRALLRLCFILLKLDAICSSRHTYSNLPRPFVAVHVFFTSDMTSTASALM